MDRSIDQWPVDHSRRCAASSHRIEQGGNVGSDVLGLIAQAGLIVKLVLFLLAAFSVFSWGIIASKWRELRAAVQDSEAFLEVYHTETFDAAFEAAGHLERGPLAVIFLSCCAEMSKWAQETGRHALSAMSSADRRRVQKVMVWSASREKQRLERGLTFLATVGSSAPFIGLFGTVIGILTTFQGIGQSGNASLAVVGPGIAEALVATAVGLLAAIPATMAFNAFVSQVDQVAESMSLFCGEFEEDLASFDRSAEATRGGE